MDKQLLNKVLRLQKQAKKEPVSITLDWLALYFTQNDHFLPDIQEGDSVIFSDKCFASAIDRPTLHFNSHMVVNYEGEECAHLLFNSKNEKFFAKDVVKVEFKNHTLYSGIWQKVLLALQKFGLRYKAASRIDIAIDGLNSMHQLLNLYAKQTRKNKTLALKNSSASRARFSAKVLNDKTMLFENFNIGGNGGNKMITVYNKTLEIVKSGKKYIQEFWLRNGLIKGITDTEKQAEAILKMEAQGHETFHLEGHENIYRFEIRLKSEAIKEIKDFNLDMLTSAAGLASIVKLHCNKFFEPILTNANKTCDCSPVNIIPFKRLGAVHIEKIQRVETDGMYKAKLTLHGIVQDLYKGRVNDVQECISTMFDRVDRYRLAWYLNNKLPDWEKKYSHSTSSAVMEETAAALQTIRNTLEPYLSDTNEDVRDIADRNGQAYSTANFGE